MEVGGKGEGGQSPLSTKKRFYISNMERWKAIILGDS